MISPLRTYVQKSALAWPRWAVFLMGTRLAARWGGRLYVGTRLADGGICIRT